MSDWNTIIGSKQANAYRGTLDSVSPCLTEAMGMGGGMIPLLTNATIEQTYQKDFIDEVRKPAIQLPKELEGKRFRIRKLSERECLRLMDVDDADIDKIQATGLSRSAQYRLAGNSIVVDVLYHIFRKMFIETTPDIKQGQPQQLSLF